MPFEDSFKITVCMSKPIIRGNILIMPAASHYTNYHHRQSAVMQELSQLLSIAKCTRLVGRNYEERECMREITRKNCIF